ncbi:type I-E CRISPR-associated protein Cse2/CasB [Rhodospirillum centenum]|uniref:CRISPR-associated protein, CT1973 family n=1 Tax=Rhodospirillum centenum (strain ATCC 51521 / SW) TaxID=414684 RepID=B6IWM5_RHOCS|nr:type I-E CRISPR-associated protein Cse2/CasB [Rhodospirillum centenum]ACJ00699.1 CRISPR-associated protein, CT1973 family [Rhodospirillum centenum SW]
MSETGKDPADTPPDGTPEKRTPEKRKGTAVERWFAALQKPLARGDRAALRRAQTVTEACMVPASYALPAALMADARMDRHPEAETVARIAMALATVDEDTGAMAVRTGAALGRAFAVRRQDTGKPRVSGDRLRLICTADDPDEFLRLLRGAIRLLEKEKAPVADIARVVEAWHRPAARDAARRQILLSYFQTNHDAFADLMEPNDA